MVVDDDVVDGSWVPLEFGGYDSSTMVRWFRDGVLEQFSKEAASTGFCTHPIRLEGWGGTVDKSTGVVVAGSLGKREMVVPCKNRRASVCPSCARVYARDTFEVVKTGVCGGKGVPAESVQAAPLVFATFTAPSFGAVHSVKGCAKRRRTVCVHGVDLSCDGGEDCWPGQALCQKCYKYEDQVMWNWHSTELWRRFTIALRRTISQRLGIPQKALREQGWVPRFVKVAEFQARGVVHFHVLIRWDGPAAVCTANMLAQMVKDVGQLVSCVVDMPWDVPFTMQFGEQLDVRVVTEHKNNAGQDLTKEQVAGYLAKYASKATTDELDLASPHGQRLMQAVVDCHRIAEEWWCGQDDPDSESHWERWRLLFRRVRTAGFRGHFSSKSPGWSVTLGMLRLMRQRFARLAAQSKRNGVEIDTIDLEMRLMSDHFEDDELTTELVGEWAYDGRGYSIFDYEDQRLLCFQVAEIRIDNEREMGASC